MLRIGEIHHTDHGECSLVQLELMKIVEGKPILSIAD